VSSFRWLRERLIHQSHVWRLVTADFEAPDGEEFTRDIVRSPGAVAVVPIFDAPNGEPIVALLRQYRPAIDGELLEIPAGMRDVPGEPPQVTAERELAEEAGYAAGSMTLLTYHYSSPGLTDASMHIYLAQDLSPVPTDVHGPEEAHMTVVRVPLRWTLDWIVEGQIADGKTVIGLLLADRHLRAAASPADP
jgi:ADP-ribose pyrophosphatase